MTCTKIALQKSMNNNLKSKVMVEKKVFSEEFKRMVAKAYYTSNKSLAKVGKEFKVHSSNVHHWSRLYKDEFSGEVIYPSRN